MAKIWTKIGETIKKFTGKGKKGKILERDVLYKYDTVEDREETIAYLYEYAKSHRSDQESKWKLYDDYYNNKHVTQIETYQYCKDNNIPWVPAIIPDPYIHVESQIIPDVPDFEFNGRDDDEDSRKAKQRQYAVQYVIDNNNNMATMNTENERQLGKLGNAFWKVSWDNSKQKPGGIFGDIVISNPDVSNIFPDPTAYDLDDCEFIDCVYGNIHKLRAARTFKNELKEKGLTIEDFGSNMGFADTEIFSSAYDSSIHDISDDTVMIIEHWFRQPYDGSETMELDINGKKEKVTIEWESGDIACSILINFKEIKYIPKFWIKTSKQNKMYPFSKYCKIPLSKSFWDKSEIESIKDLVDAADRELAMALLNDTYTANDIILVEEGALIEGEELKNEPGKMWKVKDGRSSGVQRLGGLGGNGGLQNMIDWLRSLIQETVGNFDSTMGKEPVRVTTSSGIAQLNERADARKVIKKADRTAGFERLIRLIDFMALEFYDDNRMIYLGAKGKEQDAVKMNYNSDNLMNYDETSDEWYIPDVDVKVNASDALNKSKSFTLSATENLLAKNINENNYKLAEAMIDIMNLPNRKEIKDYFEKLFGPRLELIQAQTLKQIQQLNNPPEPQVAEQVQGEGQDIEQPVKEPTMEEVLGGMNLAPDELEILQNNPDIAINAMG